MTRSRALLTFAIAAPSFALGLLLASRAPTAAQSSGPSLPASCSSGQVVVSDGFDRFRCVDLDDLLGLSSCSDGDLVTTRYGGQLRCGSPSSCSTPALVGLDTFGHVECTPRRVLPECPSGASLVSQGGGEWACGRR